MTSQPNGRSHWTPRYLADRLRLAVEERRNPEAPWLVADAAKEIEDRLPAGATVIEWGAGRSTRWFLSQGATVYSVEHHAGWADEVRAQAAGAPLELALADPDDVDAYAGAHPDLTAVDLALIDGIHRHQCATRAVELVRPGGLLVVDNVERYLPSASRAPEAIGPDTTDPGWTELRPILDGWTCSWHGNGVTDTAIWTKPAT